MRVNGIEKNRLTEENTNIGYCARKFAGEANRHLCLTAENAKEHNTKIMHRDDAADSANWGIPQYPGVCFKKRGNCVQMILDMHTVSCSLVLKTAAGFF